MTSPGLRRSAAHIAVLAAAMILTADAAAQCTLVRVTAGFPQDELGRAVAADGDYVVIGAPKLDDQGADAGGAVVFWDNGQFWQWMGKLTGSASGSGSELGESVAIDGPWVAVGAPNDVVFPNSSGTVTLFERGGLYWSEVVRLVPSDGADGDHFGDSVDLDGDVCVVGAPLKNGLVGADSGVAYVYRRVGGTWTEEAKLQAFDFKQDDRFGWRVAVSGATIAVSSPQDDDLGVDSGSLYVYEHVAGSWSLQAKLTSQLGTSKRLGENLALDGDRLVASSEVMARVAVFERSAGTWSETDSLVGHDTVAGDRYASSVALDGDVLVVGASADDDAAKDSGSVYVYRHVGGSFAHERKLVPSGYRKDEQYPQGLAISGSSVVGSIGSPLDGVASSYLSDIGDPGGCVGTTLPSIPSTPGYEQQMRFRGPASIAGDAYLVLGSATGHAPGFVVDGVKVPLNLDFYTSLTLAFPNVAPFLGFAGVVDPFGEADAKFEVPPGGLPPAASGIVLHHSVVVLSGGVVVAASEAVPLEIE